jgi:ubiquinol-cytochrome c reductase cytochrome b subunit
MGVLLMFGSIGVLFALPWLDTSKVKSLRFRPTARWFFIIFLVNIVVLGFCGAKLPDDFVFRIGEDGPGLNWVWLSRFATAYYFLYFLVIIPALGLFEKTLPLPDTISSPVLPSRDLKKEEA